MNILGIKTTHDGALALIDNGRLIFSHEMEKINNSPRYSNFMLNLPGIDKILGNYGYNLDQVDQIVLDGWGEVEMDFGKGKFPLKFADYGLDIPGPSILKEATFDGCGFRYNSYSHISGHILGAYCTSPFAREGKDAFILVWDGPVPPQLFYYQYHSNHIENLGWLFPLIGSTYMLFSVNYEPFFLKERDSEAEMLSVAGKVMAYISLGKVREDVLSEFKEIYENFKTDITKIYKTHKHTLGDEIRGYPKKYLFLIKQLIKCGRSRKYNPADMMATHHQFIQDLLLRNLQEKVSRNTGYERNLCYTGGCALNIKWNSAIRESGIFKQMWVPPFANDSGSAIGAACCEMVNKSGKRSLDWNVYQGPRLIDAEMVSADWLKQKCSLEELALLLHQENEPVVFLNGDAELGPRALGNRSILAPAVDSAMKDRLNKIKIRADYRPISPICLEEDAAALFNPGTPDPYMLYDHKVRNNWKHRIPAICHLDGTARLQTINRHQNAEIYQLLSFYKKLSGIPLLCNTSANYKGKGFFPDAKSAQEWGKVNYIWSNETLYFKK